jgi:hypothetical protein
MRGMMGGGMRGMARGIGMPRPGQMARMLKAELGWSDDQAKGLKEICSQAAKASIKQRADLRIAEPVPSTAQKTFPSIERIMQQQIVRRG